MKLAFLFGGTALIAAAGCGDDAVSRPEEPPAMTAPALTETAELIGPWALTGPSGRCDIGLLADDRPVSAGSLAAPMMEAQIASDCDLDIAGWRPIPLGLELTDADGRAVLTFERASDGGFRSTDQAWSLVRT